MKRRRGRSLEVGRRILGALFWVGLVGLSVLLALPALLPYALPWLGARYGLDVAVDRASYALPGPELRLQGLRVGHDADAFRARDLRLSVDWPALMGGDLRVAAVSLEGARVTLVPVPAERPALSAYRPSFGDGLPLPVPRALEAVDLRVSFSDGRLPDLLLENLSYAEDVDGVLTVEGEGQVTGGAFRLSGTVERTDAGNEVQGKVTLARIDLNALQPLLEPVLPGTWKGLLEAGVTARLSAGTSAAWTLVIDGRVGAVDVDARVAGLAVSGATGQWEGSLRVEPSGVTAMAVRATGRLALDRGLVGPGEADGRAGLEMEGALFEGQTGWRVEGGGPDQWTLDGDGEAARLEVLGRPWAGLAFTRTAFWGLWRGARRELSVGQLRATRVDLPPPRGGADGTPERPWSGSAEDVEVKGLSLGEDGTAVDRLASGAATLRWLPSAEPVSAARLEASEVVVTPAWARVGTLALTGLAVRAAMGDVGLQVHEATLQALRARRGEALHAGEVRLHGLALGFARDINGDWRWPDSPWPPGEVPTLDALLVAPGGRVAFTDLTTEPVLRLAFEDLEGRLSARDRDRTGRFALHARVGSDGRLDLSGELGAAGRPRSLVLQGRVTDAPLAAFSPYLRDLLGLDLAAGSLAAEGDLRLSDAPWTARARLALVGAEVVPARGASEAARGLARALRLLVDDRGRSELEVSVGADAPAAERLLEAATAAVGAVYRSLDLSDGEVRQLLRDGVVPLGQVGLDPSNSRLGATASTWLEAVAATLRPHPGARLRLCPVRAAAAAEEPGMPAAPSTEGLAREALVVAGGLRAGRVLSCDTPLPDAASGAPVQVSLEVIP